MKIEFFSQMQCPECGGRLAVVDGRVDGRVESGKINCASCQRTYAVRDGVPMFLPQLSDGVQQVHESYSAKWARTPDIYDEQHNVTELMHDWYLTRYKWESEERLSEFLQRHPRILDAGCGLGRDVRWYARLNPAGTVFGADLSDAVFTAGEKTRPYTNAAVMQADLNRLPFEPESFDFVACDQVLSNVEDSRDSLERLWSLVKPGGHMAFYVYRKKSVVREFTDDHVRARVIGLSPENAWSSAERITRFGKALSDLKVEVDIPDDVPELEIKAGRYDIQRFIYYNVLKCYWNDEMTWGENVIVNLDWFHPAFTYRYTVEEVRGWAVELGMDVLVLDEDEPSGISVLARKP